MIQINNVSKSYDRIKAVNDVSLEIKKGILFGLIGPDGAGKTTLFRLITTLLVPDKGDISVFDFDTVKNFRSIRQFTGYMPGRFSLYPDLTVNENLTFYATIFSTIVEQNYEIIKPVFKFLEPFKNRLARNLSGGMKQKLALCCALIHNPKVLVLDEPTTGVDAVSRKEFWETLNELRNTGMTILVSTPYMDEASKCDRVALIQDGKVMSEDSPSSILSQYKYPLFGIRTANRSSAINRMRGIKGIRRAYLFGHSIHVVLDPGLDKEWLKSRMKEADITELQVVRIQPDFEDCFIDAVGNN
jgi:ABC-type multidrug transport system ATPase subunit